LTAKVVFPEDVEAAKNQRYAAYALILKPDDEIQEQDLEQAVLASLRFEHCQSCEIDRRIEIATIARDPGPEWYQQRQREAACLGKTLKRDPDIVMMTLRETPAGRAWLIGQWNELLLVLDGEGTWSDVESNRALDLMGNGKNYRPQMIKLRTPFADPMATRVLILEKLAVLKAAQCRDDADNDRLRSAHIRGLITDADAKLTLIRRYEREAQRRYDKNMTKLGKAKAAQAKAAKSQPKPVNETKPNPVVAEPVYETKPNPEVMDLGGVVVRPYSPENYPGFTEEEHNEQLRRLAKFIAKSKKEAMAK